MTGFGLFSILALKWIIAVTSATTYYQKDYDGYLFTIPGFNDAERRSQSNAATWCSQNGSKLIEITNSNIQTALVMFAREAIAQNQLNGNNILTNGKRNNFASWLWINGNGYSGPSISGQSEGYVISYGYLYTNPTGFTYVADRANEKKGYICEGQYFCGNGYSISNRCYKSFNGEILTWYESRNRCLVDGGDLASFEFIQNDQQLNNLNGSWLSLSTNYWIGVHKEIWKWQSSNSGSTTTAPVSRDSSSLSKLYASSFETSSSLEMRTADVSPVSRANSTATTEYSNALIVGLVIGIPALIIIVILSIVIAKQRQNFSSQMKQCQKPSNFSSADNLANSHYEGLHQEHQLSNIDARNYQELRPHESRGPSIDEAVDYEQVRNEK